MGRSEVWEGDSCGSCERRGGVEGRIRMRTEQKRAGRRGDGQCWRGRWGKRGRIAGVLGRLAERIR